MPSTFDIKDRDRNKGDGFGPSSSSTNRGNFIRLTQKKAMNNEKRSFDHTTDFLDYLNKHIAESYKEIDDRLSKLIEKYGYGSSDEGYKFRKGFKESLQSLLVGFGKDIGSFVNQDKMSEHFLENYQKHVANLGDVMGISSSFLQMDVKGILRAINYPWSGAMWSDRVWKNRKIITDELKSIITVGLMRGDSFVNMSKKISRSLVMNEKKYKHVTERLIRTETARIRYLGDVDCYKEMGLKQVQFTAHLDNRTSMYCRDNDRKIFEFGKEPPLPIHPHCRSCYVPYLGKSDFDKRIKEQRKKENVPKPKEKNKVSTVEQRKIAKKIKHKYRGEVQKRHLTNVEYSIGTVKDMIKNNQLLKSQRSLPSLKKNLAKLEDVRDKLKSGAILEAYKGIDKKVNFNGDVEGYYIMDKPKFLFPSKNKTFWLGVGDDVSISDKEALFEMLDNVIGSDDRYLGATFLMDFDYKGEKGNYLGFNAMADDFIFLRDRKYMEMYHKNKDYCTDFLNSLESTVVHELGHRLHRKGDKLKGIALPSENWDTWEKEIEKYYAKYRHSNIKGLPRMNYPVNAQDYYKDRAKKHFYQEMFAEINAILGEKGGKGNDIKILDKMFPGIIDIFHKANKY